MMTEDMSDFIDMLRASYSDMVIEVDSFASGSVIVDLKYKKEVIVLAYSPRHGYAVSIIRENDLPFTGHDKVFQTWTMCHNYIFDLIRRVELGQSIENEGQS